MESARAANTEPTPSPFSYADVADLVSASDIIAVARIRSLTPIPAAAGANPASLQNYYVEADSKSLIRGRDALPPRVAFMIRLLPGKDAVRAIKGQTLILFGRQTAVAGQLQLLTSRAFLPWSPATQAQVQSIAAETLTPGAAPRITAIAEAFHVEGTVAGESETQIFLTTANDRPVSLSIVRRPDIAPKFGAALGEIVDEAADVPKKDTLLWYRLACTLPATLPAVALTKLAPSDADAAQRDYAAFMERLGTCPRTRPQLMMPS